MGNSLKRAKLGNSLAVSTAKKLGNSLLASGAVTWLVSLF